MSAHPVILTDPKDIILRYLSDESTKDIAASYGVTRQALGQYLVKHAEQEWKDAQVARAIVRKENADDELARIREAIKLSDQEERHRLKLSLACAEAELKSAQWDLERVCRRIYGQDVAQVTQAVQININLRRESATDAVQHEPIQLDVSKDAE
jgi:predicted DNA-binding protein YlxM (UPF0122 family)